MIAYSVGPWWVPFWESDFLNALLTMGVGMGLLELQVHRHQGAVGLEGADPLTSIHRLFLPSLPFLPFPRPLGLPIHNIDAVLLLIHVFS